MVTAKVGRKEWLGCGGLVLFVGATSGLLFLLLRLRLPGPVAGGLTGFGAFVSFIAYGFVQGSLNLLPARRLLSRAARGEQVLEDGQPAAVSGPIHAVEGQVPMEAPFTGRPCLAYGYTVEPSISGKKRSVLFGGIGSVPSEVRTTSGPLHLLGLLDLTELPVQRCLDPEDRRRAIAYMQATTFEQLDVFDWARVYQLGRRLRTETGPFRQDCRIWSTPGTGESYSYAEQCVEPRALVSVVGRYSGERRGLERDPEDDLSFVLMPGDAATAARELSRRIRWRVTAALATVAVVYAILWFVVMAKSP